MSERPAVLGKEVVRTIMVRTTILVFTAAALSGCSEPIARNHAVEKKDAGVQRPRHVIPIAGSCPKCRGSLREVPVRAGGPTATFDEPLHRGEVLLAARTGSSDDPAPALVCDSCRAWRPAAARPWQPLPAAFGSKRAGEERNDNGLGMTFCWCPPGTFRMGSPRDEPGRLPGEGPVPVALSLGFWMGKFEVTQSQWRRVMGATLRAQRAKDPSQPRPVGDGSMRDHVGEGPDHPIYFVSHAEAEEFCRKLTAAEHRAGRLPPGWDYRLPTEAQWEYACRAGTTTATPFGARLGGEDANFNGDHPYHGAPKGAYRRETTPVGSYPANAWGLHDMLGNVWEWCLDGFADERPGGVDPLGPSSAPDRVFRGGCWHDSGSSCRSAGPRHHGPPGDQRGSGLGFRVALVRTRP
jgi:formylglycine-generating enzyme required for sulfatase activity